MPKAKQKAKRKSARLPATVPPKMAGVNDWDLELEPEPEQLSLDWLRERELEPITDDDVGF